MQRHNNIKTSLDEMERSNPFKVPDSYFENFPVKMANLISKPSKEKSFVSFWELVRPKLIPALAFSSLVLLLVTTVWVYQFRKGTELTLTELADVYKYAAINESSEADLIKELERVSTPANIRNDSLFKSADNYSKAAIEYLTNENIDINSVIDAL